MPYILIIVDNYAYAVQNYPDLPDFLLSYIRDGANYGMYFINAVSTVSSMNYRLAENVKNKMSLFMSEKGDYSSIFSMPPGITIDNIKGHGICKYDKYCVEFETALPIASEDENERVLKVRELVNKIDDVWKGSRAKEIPLLPEKINYKSYNTENILLGLSKNTVENVEININERPFAVISEYRNNVFIDMLYDQIIDKYKIKTKLETYHEFNQETKTETVINNLKDGLNVAIISDAGLPVISDPGFKIVQEARRLGIPCSTIPGASAGISALVASGIAPMPYTFYGFLDSKKTKRIKELDDLKYVNHTLIFYEAPHRIYETLADMLEVFGDRYVVLARELTKTFEEYISGSISDVLKEENIKGEIVLIVEGFKERKEALDDPYQKIDELISLGYKPIDAIKEVAKIYNLDRKELYKNYVDSKK